ncbi:hypothetical protein BF93_03695 [Brachybacterium phenoliresistens]|uniref:AraC effector-binding domain-containing protein n=1 Tax=Brachybacterium phenoliresistens TaxID=396014 RepID=Z9JQ31_9MICO
MTSIEVQEKGLPALRLAVRTVTVPDQPAVAGVVGPLFDEVADGIGADAAAAGTPVALYDMNEDGVEVTAGFTIEGEPGEGCELLELPTVPRALSAVHHGTMAGIGESWRALHTAVLEHGLVPDWPCREVYLVSDSEDQQDWVTELQQPVQEEPLH